MSTRGTEIEQLIAANVSVDEFITREERRRREAYAKGEADGCRKIMEETFGGPVSDAEMRRRVREDPSIITHWTQEAVVANRELDEKTDDLAHLYAMRLATKTGHLVLRPRPFATGNVRLLAHEFLQQLRNPARARLLLGLREKTDAADPDDLESLYRKVTEAQKFDLRSIIAEDIEPNAAFADELDEAGLLRLPFSQVWFEWDIEPGYTVGALGIDHPNRPIFTAFVRASKFGWAQWRWNDLDVVESLAIKFTRAAVVILSSLSAQRTEIAAPIKLNRRREAAGKPPLFSHTVVEIRGVTLDHKTGQPLGHERRSPRMHWRRGHLRRFRNSVGEVYRITAIAPMLVGRASLGKVEHDYILGKGESARP